MFQKLSGVHEQMDILGQLFRNSLNDVATEEIKQSVANGSTKHQQGGPHRCRDVHDGVGYRVTHRVTRKHWVSISSGFGIGENHLRLFVFLPAPALVGFTQHRHRADKQQIERPPAEFSFLKGEFEGFSHPAHGADEGRARSGFAVGVNGGRSWESV